MSPSVPAPHPGQEDHLRTCVDEGFEGLAQSVERVRTIARDSMQTLGCAFFRLHSQVGSEAADASPGDRAPAVHADPPAPVTAAVAESVTCLQFEDLLTQMLADVQARLAVLREAVDRLANDRATSDGDEARLHELRARLTGRADTLHDVGAQSGDVEIF